MQEDPAPAAIHAPAPPRGLCWEHPHRHPSQNSQLPPALGACLGVRADLAPSWGIYSRIKAKGGDTGCGVLIEASPPHVPSRRAWPAASLQQLRQGGGSGKDAHKSLRYPFFRQGRELRGSVKAGEVWAQHSSWQSPGMEESRGSEGILEGHQTSLALGDGLRGGTEQTSQYPQSLSWF